MSVSAGSLAMVACPSFSFPWCQCACVRLSVGLSNLVPIALNSAILEASNVCDVLNYSRWLNRLDGRIFLSVCFRLESLSPVLEVGSLTVRSDELSCVCVHATAHLGLQQWLSGYRAILFHSNCYTPSKYVVGATRTPVGRLWLVLPSATSLVRLSAVNQTVMSDTTLLPGALPENLASLRTVCTPLPRFRHCLEARIRLG